MRRAIPLVFGAMLVGLVAAGCSSDSEGSPISIETTVGDTTTTTAPAATTTTELVVADAGCVACHTDQETLQVMAVEPVAGEVLSEGEG